MKKVMMLLSMVMMIAIVNGQAKPKEVEFTGGKKPTFFINDGSATVVKLTSDSILTVDSLNKIKIIKIAGKSIDPQSFNYPFLFFTPELLQKIVVAVNNSNGLTSAEAGQIIRFMDEQLKSQQKQ